MRVAIGQVCKRIQSLNLPSTPATGLQLFQLLAQKLRVQSIHRGYHLDVFRLFPLTSTLLEPFEERFRLHPILDRLLVVLENVVEDLPRFLIVCAFCKQDQGGRNLVF